MDQLITVMLTVNAPSAADVPQADDVLAALKSVPELGGVGVTFSISINRTESQSLYESPSNDAA